MNSNNEYQQKKIVISQQSWNLEQHDQLFIVFGCKYEQTNKQKYIHIYTLVYAFIRIKSRDNFKLENK